VTRRERLLAERDAVMPWARRLALIAPHNPTHGLGRPGKDLELMLRVYSMIYERTSSTWLRNLCTNERAEIPCHVSVCAVI
jgi:hypothetical protein